MLSSYTYKYIYITYHIYIYYGYRSCYMHQPPSQLTTMSDPQEALKPPFVGWSKAARPIQPVGQETKSTRSSKNLTHTYYIQFISYYPILVASKSYWFCWQHPVFWQMFASYVHFVTCLDPILPWAEPVPSFLAVEPHPFFPFFSASTSFMSMAPSSNRKSLTGDGCSFFSRHGLRLFSQYGPNGSMMLKFHPCSSGYLVDILWICRICVRLKLHNAMLRPSETITSWWIADHSPSESHLWPGILEGKIPGDDFYVIYEPWLYHLSHGDWRLMKMMKVEDDVK